MELGEAFLEGLVGQLVRRELDEVHYLSCVCMAQSSDAVVKLGEAASKSSDSKLSFCLSKPYMWVVSPELESLRATACIPSLAEAEGEAGAEDGSIVAILFASLGLM